MKIGVIGSGKMGLGLGKLWANSGHRVFFSDMNPDVAEAASVSVKHNSRSGSVRQAAVYGEVLLLAVPYTSVYNAVEPLLEDKVMKDKILIDCINPLAPDLKSLIVGHSTSAAEEIAGLFPASMKVKVVKALNTIASPILESGSTLFGKDKSTVFYCGDDSKAKSLVARLIEDLKFEPVDAGPLVNSRFLEPLAALIIQLAISQEMGTNIAIKLLKK